jgi:hypothetical protein
MGALYLAERIPVREGSDIMGIIGFLLDLSQRTDSSVRERCLVAAGKWASHFPLEELPRLWSVRDQFLEGPHAWLWQPMAFFFDQSPTVSADLTDEVIGEVYAALSAGFDLCFTSALSLISSYVKNKQNMNPEESVQIGQMIFTRLTTLGDDDLMAVLTFLGIVKRWFPYHIFQPLVDACLTAAELAHVEERFVNCVAIARLLPFMNPESALLQAQNYVQMLQQDPVKYLCLIGPLLKYVGSEMLKELMEEARRQSNAPSDQLHLVRHFWKHCLMTGDPVAFAAVEQHFGELITALISSDSQILAHIPRDLLEAGMRLIGYWTQFDHANGTVLLEQLMQSIQNVGNTELESLYLAVCTRLARHEAIPLDEPLWKNAHNELHNSSNHMPI